MVYVCTCVYVHLILPLNRLMLNSLEDTALRSHHCGGAGRFLSSTTVVTVQYNVIITVQQYNVTIAVQQ